MPLRLRDGDTQTDRNRQTHAAQHVKVLRPLAGRPQIEIGVADAADHGFLALELADQAFGQLKAVHHFCIMGGSAAGGVMGGAAAGCIVRAGRAGGRLRHGGAHCLNTLPPVSSGDRMKVTGASVATACLIERSMIKASSSIRVMVWVSTPSESSTGRMVLHTNA